MKDFARAATVMATGVFAVLLTAFGTLSAVPAHAAGPNDLEISLDGGATWSTSASGQLFDGVNLVVPGDRMDDQFLLRNVGDTAGAVRITLRDVSYTDPIFAEVFTVRVSTPGITGTPVVLTDAAPCRVLNVGQVLGPGQQLVVDAHAELGDLHGSDGQNALATFTIRSAIHDLDAIPQAPSYCDVIGADAPTGPTNPNPGQIAYTGTEIPLPLIIGTAALIGVGLFFVIAARRKRKEGEDQ